LAVLAWKGLFKIMAPPKKIKVPVDSTAEETNASSAGNDAIDGFTKDLIKDLNKGAQERIAYNLATDESPTNINRWISTGSTLLDYYITNKRNGGVPEGRIIEIFGQPSIGKSHLAYQIARSTQSMGGVVVYIDTENATSTENLALLGVDIRRRFAFVETSCTEEVFKVMESSILKFRNLNKDVPLLIVWDSVAATSPKAELEGEYDANTIGLQARVLSKGFRKITQLIGNKNVTLVLLNQIRLKVGVLHGDPCVSPDTIITVRKKVQE
jgi:recombination protein RecA